MHREKLESSLFLTLDGMRGVGAILVVMGHSILFWGSPIKSPPIPFCVDLFFIMSGFVIAFAYEPRFAAGMKARDFLRQRFARLYPLYLLGTLLGAAVLLMAALGDGAKLSAFGLSLGPQLLMLPSPDFGGTGDIYPLNMPAWTLLFELFANVVYVLVWRWLSTRTLAIVVALSFALLAVVTISYGTLDQGASWWNFSGGFARAMFGFFAGVLVFRVLGSPKATPRKRSWLALPALLAVPLLCLIPQTPATRPFTELAIAGVAGPLLLWWAQGFQPPRAFTVIFAWLGAMSYALYVVHYPLFELMKRLAGRFPDLYTHLAPWSGMAILAVSLAMASAAAFIYDGPARRTVNRFLKAFGRKPQPAVHAE